MPDDSTFPQQIVPPRVKRRSRSTKPTVEDYAALEFKGTSAGAMQAHLQPLPEWVKRSKDEWQILSFAMAVLEKDQDEMVSVVRGGGCDEVSAMTDAFIDLRDRLQGFGAILDSAIIRSMAGLARFSRIEEGAVA